MATITASEVKTLRERTGAGMMECKAALVETDGNLDDAITLLRKRGLAQAAKRAGRATSEGSVGALLAPDGKRGALVEVNCETDFVARTDDFQALVREAAEAVMAAGEAASPEWLANPQGPVAQKVTAAIAKTGENMAAPRCAFFASDGFITQDIHLGGKIGVMVDVRGPAAAVTSEAGRTLGKELAMHVAAASPQFVTRTQVSSDALERERSIYRAQLEGQNKPANVIEKIVEGKLGSFYEQVVLLDQPSIRDPKVKVSQVIADASKAAGGALEIARFVRLKLGESA
ncbi:MAG: translation elongation factor Ts [Vicinamibacterales bacterium]